MGEKTFPKLEEIISNHLPNSRLKQLSLARGLLSCLALTTTISPHKSAYVKTPQDYVSAQLPNWTQGNYENTESYLSPEHTLIVDIETRGLAKNNQTWMVGLAYAENKKLVIEQLIAQDSLQEKSILQVFAQRAEQRPNWISFNGKAFDQTRSDYRAKSYGLSTIRCDKHLDGYQILSQLAKKRHLHGRSLQYFESLVFPRFKRVDDIAGAEIPKAYTNYLAGGDPLPLARAITHNAHDLVSLAAFYLMLLDEEMHTSHKGQRIP